MKKYLRSLWFSVHECGLNIRHSVMVTLISVMTICISLTMLGGFGTVSLNVIIAIKQLRKKVDMEVYLVDGLNRIQTEEIRSEVGSLAGIREMVYISKEEALKEGRIQEDFLSILDHNPLPASIRLTFRKGNRTDQHLKGIAEQIKQIRGVEEVVYGREWITVLDRITQTFIILDVFLGLLICLASAFVVANTIRLTYSKRKDNVEIMQLVGATRSMIKRPFVLEGMLQGLLGGTGASLVLYWMIKLINPYIFIPITVPGKHILGGLLGLGIVLGYLGSTLSIGSFIRSVRRKS